MYLLLISHRRTVRIVFISNVWLTNSSCCCYLGLLTILSVYRQPCFYGIWTTCQFAPLALVYCCNLSYGWVSKPYKRDRNNTTAIPDELVRHSKSIPMATGKLVSLLKLSETANSRFSHGWPSSPVGNKNSTICNTNELVRQLWSNFVQKNF